MTKVFPLRCEAPIDFEYQLTYLQPHQAFTVYPMSGKIDIYIQPEILDFLAVITIWAYYHKFS